MGRWVVIHLVVDVYNGVIARSRHCVVGSVLFVSALMRLPSLRDSMAVVWIGFQCMGEDGDVSSVVRSRSFEFRGVVVGFR